MEDVTPELLDKIKKEFEQLLKEDKTINEVMEKIVEGTADYQDANAFALSLGDILSKAYGDNLSSDVLPDGKMYYNIAKRIIDPTMRNNYDLISETTSEIQTLLNKQANIGIKAIKPELDQENIDNIINKISAAGKYDDVSWMLDSPIQHFSQNIVDETIRANAEFHSKSGMKPKIIRKLAGNCCDWCRALAGTYAYPDVPKDVYRRHNNCRCTVEYHPGDGKVQDVHTKQWQTEEERAKIEERKIIGLTAEDNEIINNIRENVIPQQNISNLTVKQETHKIGTPQYEVRKKELEAKGEYGPSYITISDDEILELVKKYSGKGKIKYNRQKEWDGKESILTNKKIVGVVIDNRNGRSAETSVFKIHYAKNGFHIVPDYPSKKR